MIWENKKAYGFLAVALFYLIGLGSTVVLAQFMPVADMCNPGPRFMTGMLSILIGALPAAITPVIFLMGKRSGFIKGSLLAHLAILDGIFLLIAGVEAFT